MIDDVLDGLRAVVADAEGDIHAAADAIVATGRAGGLVRPAGAGHSLAAVMEAFFRAGGLAFVQPLWHERVLPFAGASSATAAEREPGLGRSVAEAAAIEARDVVLVISNSGANPYPVEIAQVGAEAGATVIALTSRAANAAAPTDRAPVRLVDVASIVLDTQVRAGDASWPFDAPVTAPTSSLVTTALWTAILRAVHDRWPEAPRWRSANVVGSDGANQALFDALSPRIPELR
ncbi:sugar isomerase domain-containing protein [Agrococcus sp. SGAir0287]|uniref:sugar isomerase domain-containing protein n=1 Tax=Agrococcus sp. SGAir0287 TaxID=2070347 RepID=UPI0015867079|nr:sugar isomerase domain-containing protein [Agrococcus sp. SGAir0287]